MAKQPVRVQPTRPAPLPAPRPASPVTRGTPTPGTKAQGYLSSRFNRRNGNIFTRVNA